MKHSYKHATTARMGKVTQIFLQDDAGHGSVSILRGHHNKRDVDKQVASIMGLRPSSAPAGAF